MLTIKIPNNFVFETDIKEIISIIEAKFYFSLQFFQFTINYEVRIVNVALSGDLRVPSKK